MISWRFVHEVINELHDEQELYEYYNRAVKGHRVMRCLSFQVVSALFSTMLSY